MGETIIEGPLYAPRKKVYPQAVHGRFRRIKWALLAVGLPLFVTLSDGSVRNDYTLRFLNKAGLPRTFALEVLGLPAAEIRAAGIDRGADGRLIVEVGADQTREVRVSVQVPAAKLPKEAADIEFRAAEIATGQAATVRDHFVPASR